MKKIITVLLSLTIFTATAFAASNFKDVNNDTFYKPAIDWMAQNEVINGYPDGSFGPDICVNRVELLKMLFKTLDVNIESYNATLFSDTPEGQWYTQYVIAGRARGTINGYPDGTFKPGQCVNRVEAIKMAILEFNDGEIPDPSGMFGNPHDVAKITDNPWWKPYFVSVMGAGSVGTDHFTKFNADWSGLGVDSDFANPTYNFGPGESMTRKEVAEMLYRMKAMQDNGMEYYDGNITPNDLIQKESPQYSSIDKYVDLALNSSTNGQYKTSKPSEFQRAKFGGKGEEINVAPDGVSADVFVVAKSNWDVGDLEDIQTFYLEVVGPSPCWTEPNCTEPNTVDFYGPFEGKLKLLVQ